MKGSRAYRINISIGDLWESPILHILLTKEENVVVARCLDFTISCHGKDEKDALTSLADSVKEYVLTALENDVIDTIFDPANGKYWRMYNELEAKQSKINLKKSLRKSFHSESYEDIKKSAAEISYA